MKLRTIKRLENNYFTNICFALTWERKRGKLNVQGDDEYDE